MGKPWFEAKRFGYGVSPASREGWIATAVLVLLVLLDVTFVQGVLRWPAGAGLILAFAALAYAKSGSGWRWRSSDR
ncbi:hypothetical protein [Rhodopila sp.]|uniref:hypothetical protein n=1 Tax=Rhodopila sp. TaxID=2480087 RepID=UPI002D808196|nr:hypothetical protein [Rhodopila sp.]